MTFLYLSTWFIRFCVVYCDRMSYTTLSSQEKPLFQKRIRPFFGSVHPFACTRQHYFSKYWGTNAWAIPHLKFLGGQFPQVSAPGKYNDLYSTVGGRPLLKYFTRIYFD